MNYNDIQTIIDINMQCYDGYDISSYIEDVIRQISENMFIETNDLKTLANKALEYRYLDSQNIINNEYSIAMINLKSLISLAKARFYLDKLLEDTSMYELQQNDPSNYLSTVSHKIYCLDYLEREFDATDELLIAIDNALSLLKTNNAIYKYIK